MLPDNLKAEAKAILGSIGFRTDWTIEQTITASEPMGAGYARLAAVAIAVVTSQLRATKLISNARRHGGHAG